MVNRDSEEPFGNVPQLTQLEQAQRDFRMKLEFLMSDMQASKYYLCLPPKDSVNFRYSVFPDYKKHRQERPEIVTEMYQWVRENFETYGDAGGETDDIIADLWGDPYLMGDATPVVVSNDKDFRQLPGWHLHPFTGDLTYITEAEADVNFWYQVLAGDSADGYAGAPGIGDVKAREILMTAVSAIGISNLPSVVLFTYLSQRSTFEDYCLNVRMAKLGRIEWRPNPKYMSLPASYYKVLEMTNET
jgi:hypothetical protein